MVPWRARTHGSTGPPVRSVRSKAETTGGCFLRGNCISSRFFSSLFGCARRDPGDRYYNPQGGRILHEVGAVGCCAVPVLELEVRSFTSEYVEKKEVRDAYSQANQGRGQGDPNGSKIPPSQTSSMLSRLCQIVGGFHGLPWAELFHFLVSIWGEQFIIICVRLTKHIIIP